MKVKDYFKQAFTHFCKFFQRLAQGVYYALRRLFAQYPNPTWAVIVTAIVITSYVQIGKARAERDSYGKENTELQQQIDSLQGKEIRFSGYKE